MSVTQYAPQGTGLRTVETIVITLRDPDYSNDYAAWTKPVGLREDQRMGVHVHDVDAGSMDLSDPEEFTEWADSHSHKAAELRQAGWAEAAAYLEGLVTSYAERYDHTPQAGPGVEPEDEYEDEAVFSGDAADEDDPEGVRAGDLA